MNANMKLIKELQMKQYIFGGASLALVFFALRATGPSSQSGKDLKTVRKMIKTQQGWLKNTRADVKKCRANIGKMSGSLQKTIVTKETTITKLTEKVQELTTKEKLAKLEISKMKKEIKGNGKSGVKAKGNGQSGGKGSVTCPAGWDAKTVDEAGRGLMIKAESRFNQCIGVRNAHEGSVARKLSCNRSSANQRWVWMADHKLQLQGTNLCLTYGRARRYRLSLINCANTGSHWVYNPEKSRFRMGERGWCIDGAGGPRGYPMMQQCTTWKRNRNQFWNITPLKHSVICEKQPRRLQLNSADSRF